MMCTYVVGTYCSSQYHPITCCFSRLKRHQEFMPFGAGLRLCTGEPLARKVLFLLTARLLQKVRLNPVPGETYDTTPDPNYPKISVPQAFSVAIESVTRH